MPPDAPGPGTPARWLAFARSDLALASGPAGPDVLPATLCFHAQQAAEKAVKAVLVHAAVPAPRTHDLSLLLSLVPARCAPPPDPSAAAELTGYAVAARYPGVEEEVTPHDLQEAVSVAAAVVAWAERTVSGDPPSRP